MTFKPLIFLKCLIGGHSYKNSRAKPGHYTCQHCGFRKRHL